MYNTDTLSLNYNFGGKDYSREILLNDPHITTRVSLKIKNKLYRLERNLEEFRMGKFNGARVEYDGYNFYYNIRWGSLTVELPHNKVECYTVEEILFNLDVAVKTFFELDDDEMVEPFLSRIDVKNDYLCKNDEELAIIKNIFSKSKDSYRFYNKRIKGYPNGGYEVRYSSQRTKNYKTTEDKRQIFKNYPIYDQKKTEDGNYVELEGYDKGKQIAYKVEIGKVDESELYKYKNVWRSEVRIKNGKLNSNVFEDGKMVKRLQTYYNEEMTSTMYDDFIEEIIGVSDFYRIDVAVKLVNNSKFSKKKKRLMKRLLILVNKLGYTEAVKQWSEEHCKTSIYTYIRELNAMNINILTFNKRICDKPVKAEKLVNFGQRKNGIRESYSQETQC